MAAPRLIQWDVIPHKEHRYPTCGDWYPTGDVLRVFSSKLSDPRYEMLTCFHETTEALLCEQAGITAADIDAFDMAYEECRRLKLRKAPCGCPLEIEPGDDLHAPYGDMHETATACEKLMAKALGVDWQKYEEEVESL